MAVMLIDGTTKHYIGNLDLGKDEHSAVNLVDALADLLGVRFNSCKAIVTDSPNVIKRLRLDFCAKYPWIVNVKCVLHVMN